VVETGSCQQVRRTALDPKRSLSVEQHRVLVPCTYLQERVFEKGFDVLGNGTAKAVIADCCPNADLSQHKSRAVAFFSALLLPLGTGRWMFDAHQPERVAAVRGVRPLASGEIVTLTRCGCVTTQS
jgi:hypothetical protein